jgi:hypothetical protein
MPPQVAQWHWLMGMPGGSQDTHRNLILNVLESACSCVRLASMFLCPISDQYAVEARRYNETLSGLRRPRIGTPK